MGLKHHPLWQSGLIRTAQPSIKRKTNSQGVSLTILAEMPKSDYAKKDRALALRLPLD
jgi:hypothetical protein